ncbi:MAG: polysaccharide biosynthesis/export family protein [Tsuneonella sp.]
MRISGFFALLALVLLSACSTGPKYGAPGSAAQPVSGDALPAPSIADTHNTRDYRVAPLDSISVAVYDMPELSIEKVQVGANGKLTYPLAGEMIVGGMTPTEIESLMQERLRAAHIRNPQVKVNLLETLTQVVTVDGQVNQPGTYPVIADMTLGKAIATARGLKEFAKPTGVVVVRTVNGQKMAGLYNLNAIRRGVYADPPIYANDTIFVDESLALRYFGQALSVFSTLSYPLVAIVQ